jgi:hypothetical protein
VSSYFKTYPSSRACSVSDLIIESVPKSFFNLAITSVNI